MAAVIAVAASTAMSKLGTRLSNAFSNAKIARHLTVS